MQKTPEEETKYLERILSENSNSILFARLADKYLQSDRVDEAIELCELGIKKHPTYATGHFILGKCYLMKKSFDQAEKELKRAITYDPKYMAAHREYGELMAQIGWTTTSEMTFQTIVNIDPLNEKAKTRLTEIKQLLFDQKTEKKEEPDEPKFEISEMNDSFLATSDTVEDEKQEQQPDVEEFDLMDRIQEEKTEAEAQNNSDKEDDSMDLLEDIFRDTSIPELESDELPSSEEKIAAGMEPGITDQNDTESPFDGSSRYSPLDQPKPNEVAPEEFHAANEITDDSAEEDLTPFQELMEQSDSEPLPPTDMPEQSLWESQIEQPDEAEKPDEENISAEKIGDTLTGLDKKQPDQNDINDLFKSMQNKEPEEPIIDGFMEPPKLESEPISEPPEKDTFQPQIENDEDQEDKKKEKIVTPTLGEIYTAQHQYAKAINVYEILLKKEPDNEYYKQKIEYLNKKIEESENE